MMRATVDNEWDVKPEAFEEFGDTITVEYDIHGHIVITAEDLRTLAEAVETAVDGDLRLGFYALANAEVF